MYSWYKQRPWCCHNYVYIRCTGPYRKLSDHLRWCIHYTYRYRRRHIFLEHRIDREPIERIPCNNHFLYRDRYIGRMYRHRCWYRYCEPGADS